MQLHVWQRNADGKLTFSITQTAKIEALLDKFGMDDYNATASPYRSGTVIDRIPKDGVDPAHKPKLVKTYQRLTGSLHWLSLNTTRPELTVLVSLLSSHLHNPSSGHITPAKHVLSWLSGTRNHGI
jgi:hypothetical protein